MTATLQSSGVRTSTPTPAVVPDPGITKCFSCGKPASVRKWYADPVPPEFCCGRCALAAMGDTCGVIADVIFDLGASS